MAAMVLRKNRPSSLIALLLMTPDTPIIPFLPVLDALDLTSNEVLMEEKALRLPIMTNNWPAQYGYMPLTCVDLAYTDTGLYLRFYSRGRELRISPRMRQLTLTETQKLWIPCLCSKTVSLRSLAARLISR